MNELIVSKWVEGATNNRAVAQDMFSLKHFSWALFMQHLALEKLIKAVISSKNLEVPHIHDLWKLSSVAEIDFSSIDIGQKELDEISTFNLEARYEDYKFDFYKKATKEYTEHWMSICDSIYQFLIKELP